MAPGCRTLRARSGTGTPLNGRWKSSGISGFAEIHMDTDKKPSKMAHLVFEFALLIFITTVILGMMIINKAVRNPIDRDETVLIGIIVFVIAGIYDLYDIQIGKNNVLMPEV